MKTWNMNILHLALIVTCTIPVHAQQGPATVTSQIVRVKIYQEGAEVFRLVKTQVPKGVSELVVSGLSPVINSATIQVSTTQHVAVLGVKYRANFLTPWATSERLMQLKDTIEKLSRELEWLEWKQYLLDQESELYMKNRAIGGTQVGIRADELEKVSEIFRKRMHEIYEVQFKQENQIRQLNIEISKRKRQLAEHEGKREEASGELVLQLASENEVASEISLSYLVSRAGWKPLYDIHAEAADQPLNVIYKANVEQSCGEEWREVPLILSTGKPASSANVPVLESSKIQQLLRYGSRASTYVDGVQTIDRSGNSVAVMVSSHQLSNAHQEALRHKFRGQSLNNVVQQNSGALDVSYEIGIPYTIPGDGKPQLVSLKSYQLNGSFSHISVPKAEKCAFLIARISGWRDLYLMPGPANLFYKGSFTGQSTLDINASTDTLELSFGRDMKMLVDRQLLVPYNTRQFVSGRKAISLGYEIIVSNTNQVSGQIKIQDQIPVTVSDEIRIDELKIEAPEGVFTQHDKEKGLLHWNLQLSPGEIQKIRVQYRVVYPKDMRILGN
jgi:uncharacterized protein (TIGR02231 family)